MGRFIIHELELVNDFTIGRLSADIEQHCGNTDAGMFVAIRYNAVGSALPFAGVFPRYGFTAVSPQHGTITGPGVTCGTAGSVCRVDFGAAQWFNLHAVPDTG